MFGRILQQSFSRQRRRKGLAALAVVSGMAVASAMLTLRVNMGDDLNAELRTIGANLVVTPASDSLPVTLNGVDLRPAGSGALLPEAELPKIRQIFWANNIVAAAPVLDAPATVQGRAVTVEGTEFAQMRKLASAWAVDGAWPAESGQALVGSRLARGLGVRPGARIRAVSGGRAVSLEVAGVASTGAAQDNEILAALPLVQQLADAPGQYRELLVSAITKPEDAFARRDPAGMTAADMERWMCSPYAVTIAAQLQEALPHSSARVIRPVASSEGAILSRLRLLIWFLTGLALAASALAISGAMTAAVLERRGEIALMKAVGADDRAVGLLFFCEAGLLGLGGGALGFVAGELLATGIAGRVLGHGVAWKPALLPLVLLLAAGVALAGSWRPLRRAMRIEPAEALRGDA